MAKAKFKAKKNNEVSIKNKINSIIRNNFQMQCIIFCINMRCRLKEGFAKNLLLNKFFTFIITNQQIDIFLVKYMFILNFRMALKVTN
ncbi:hypothetical protein H311_03251 [Anncaliia algerae PRA109]|nr:hypothetical protein H311_03251 [Anncaliia algerae PRA109]